MVSEDEFYDTVFNEVLESSSSDDEDDLYVAAAHIVAEARGFIDGHRVLNRDRQCGHSRLFQDYFSDDPTYGANYFRRRFVLSPHSMKFLLYIRAGVAN
jgi:hypothetical protein